MGEHARSRIKTGAVALTIVCAMLFAMLFSFFYIALESGHDCSGEDCRICSFIHQCAGIMRASGKSAAKTSVFVPFFILLLLFALLPGADFVSCSPVSVKVRLNN